MRGLPSHRATPPVDDTKCWYLNPIINRDKAAYRSQIQRQVLTSRRAGADANRYHHTGYNRQPDARFTTDPYILPLEDGG